MSSFRERAAQEMRERRPSATVTPIMRQLTADAADRLRFSPPDARARATAARAYTVDHLEELHATVAERFAARGIGYHRAATPEDAVGIIRRLLGDARRVAKSKTMVGEEVGLTHALRHAGIDVLETDIGEYIVDVEGRGPSHITAPALHLDRRGIQQLLVRAGADLPDDDPGRLSRYVRDIVGAYFRDCDAAITGANAVIASSGRIVIVENEGNVSLGVSHPRLHIAITGIEKVVASEADALAILEVLAPSATAQPLTSFTHFLADPAPGQQRHVVFVDHGRSRILADERYRDLLKCIRCGACMNACPVYSAAGGISYGSPYMGPIGAVVSPLLWSDGRFADLPFASSLCGRCTEVCPVGIPLHRMLLDLRADAVAAKRAGSRKERAAWRAWSLAFGGAVRARTTEALMRIGLRGTARFVPGRETAGDPRALPTPAVSRDPAMLEAAPRPRPVVVPLDELLPDDLPGLFRHRAQSLGVAIPPSFAPLDGDRELRAAAGIAATGSVLLTGAAADRRALLAARRVCVRLPESALVRYPFELAAYLGDGDALLLTGASRTADIEKQIVRGIHGSEDLSVVLEG